MVEVGEIEITGTMNDSDIGHGFDRIKSDFEDIQNQANQTDSSMSNLSGTASALGGKLLTIGTVGVGALTALASKSPLLAGTFAKLEVSMMKLSNTLGPIIKPIFEGTIDFLDDFDSWVNKNEGTISNITSTIGEGVSDLGSALQGEWDKINNIIPKGSGVATGIAIGAKTGGLWGMLAGAALGYIAGDLMVPDVTAEEKEEHGVYAESQKSADTTMSYFEKADEILRKDPSFDNFMDAIGQIGKGVSSGLVTGTNFIWDFIEDILIDKNTQNSDEAQDFIARPGMGIQKFSPDDTVIGIKEPEKLFNEEQPTPIQQSIIDEPTPIQQSNIMDRTEPYRYSSVIDEPTPIQYENIEDKRPNITPQYDTKISESRQVFGKSFKNMLENFLTLFNQKDYEFANATGVTR